MIRNLLNKLFGNLKQDQKSEIPETDSVLDIKNLTGNDFEFLITPGDVEIRKEDFDAIMTPDSLHWTRVIKDDWSYFQVDSDEFSYSLEEPGIQMVFNKEISYDKAKAIADEVVSKLSKYTGQKIELVFISKNQIISF